MAAGYIKKNIRFRAVYISLNSNPNGSIFEYRSAAYTSAENYDSLTEIVEMETDSNNSDFIVGE